MSWLQVLQVLWPIAVTLLPLVVAGGFLWLKTQFPTKAELGALEKEFRARIEDHAERFNRGSAKFANHDKRLALVEDECQQVPTRNDLNQGLATLAGRMSGVESSVRGLDKTVSTQNDYIRTLLEKGMEK